MGHGRAVVKLYGLIIAGGIFSFGLALFVR